MQWMNEHCSALSDERAALELRAAALLERRDQVQNELNALLALEERVTKAQTGDWAAIGSVAALCQQLGLEWSMCSVRGAVEVVVYPPQGEAHFAELGTREVVYATVGAT